MIEKVTRIEQECIYPRFRKNERLKELENKLSEIIIDNDDLVQIEIEVKSILLHNKSLLIEINDERLIIENDAYIDSFFYKQFRIHYSKIINPQYMKSSMKSKSHPQNYVQVSLNLHNVNEIPQHMLSPRLGPNLFIEFVNLKKLCLSCFMDQKIVSLVFNGLQNLTCLILSCHGDIYMEDYCLQDLPKLKKFEHELIFSHFFTQNCIA